MNIDDVMAKLPEGVFTLRDRVAQVMRIVGGDEPAKEPTRRMFTRGYLRDDLDLLGGKNSIRETLTVHSRLSLCYEIVFKTPDLPDGYGWETSYSVGATESQDECPWQDEDEIECTLVKLGKQTVDAWIPAVMPENGGA